MPSTPYWPWCPQAGAARASKLKVDINEYGDGYVHRSTRGLNPVRPEWSLIFPFTELAHLTEMDAFLQTNAAAGFWFTPPDSAVELFATCDEWSPTLIDRSGQGALIGTLQATFRQSFNPQPISALAALGGRMPRSTALVAGPRRSSVVTLVRAPLGPNGEMLPQPVATANIRRTPTGASR